MNSWLITSLFFLTSICRYSPSTALEKRTKAFFIYRTNSIIQKSCTCGMPFSCSCCENVIILFQKEGKRLCVNFTYQRNGLNVDISLNSDILRNMTITNYKPFRMCVPIPRCLFSVACANILEFNQFPRSITACLRLDITAKKELWQISYNCMSISTELPTMASPSTEMSTTEAPTTMSTGMMPTNGMPVMPPTQMATGEMPMTTNMMQGMTEMTETSSATSAMPPAMSGMGPAMPPAMSGMGPAMPPAMSGMPPKK